MPGGKAEKVRWDDLREVAIVTTDGGPWRDDVLWVLEGDDGGCVVGSEAEGAAGLLPRLQQLPGFDNKAVIAAMGSADNARFVCWKRPDAVVNRTDGDDGR